MKARRTKGREDTTRTINATSPDLHVTMTESQILRTCHPRRLCIGLDNMLTPSRVIHVSGNGRDPWKPTCTANRRFHHFFSGFRMVPANGFEVECRSKSSVTSLFFIHDRRRCSERGKCRKIQEVHSSEMRMTRLKNCGSVG